MTDQPPPEAGGMLTPAEAIPAAPEAIPAAPEATVDTAVAGAPTAAGAATGAGAAWPPATAPQAPATQAPTAGAWVQPPQPAGPPPGAWSSYAAAPQRGPAAGWEYAGFWIRAAAWIIDGFILGFITMALWAVVLAIAAAIGIGAVATSGIDTTNGLTEEQGVVLGVGIAAAFIFLGVMTLLVTVFYFVLFWVKRGATFGQSILGLRVVRQADGGPIGWGAAIIRYIVLYIGFAVFYLGVIWVAFDDRKRGWHDLAASTLVVKRG